MKYKHNFVVFACCHEHNKLNFHSTGFRSSLSGFLMGKRLFDSQTDRLIKSSLLLHASTRPPEEETTGFWPCRRNRGSRPNVCLGKTRLFRLNWIQGHAPPKVGIPNIQFIPANLIHINTVKQQDTVNRKETLKRFQIPNKYSADWTKQMCVKISDISLSLFVWESEHV